MSAQGQQGRAHKFEADSVYHSVQALTPLAQGRQGEKEVEIMRSPDQEREPTFHLLQVIPCVGGFTKGTRAYGTTLDSSSSTHSSHMLLRQIAYTHQPAERKIMLTNERFQAPACFIGAELASLLIADEGEMIGSGRGGARRGARQPHIFIIMRGGHSPQFSEVAQCPPGLVVVVLLASS